MKRDGRHRGYRIVFSALKPSTDLAGMSQVNLEQCYEIVMEAVKAAAKIMKEGFEGTKKVDIKTASYDIVTEYDKKVEDLLINALKETFPDHRFIGEETSSKVELTDEPTWVIDPIDGTTNFVHGIPYCAISIGLAVDREVVLGIVCCPPLNQTYSAIKGKGAFLNGKPIHVSKTKDLENAVLGQEISLAAIPHLTDILTQRYKIAVTKCQGLRSIGCAQMSLCQVAQGTFDAYEVEWLYPWDVAAGSIIVTEAGGTVFNVDGSKFDCEQGGIIAAGTESLALKLVELFK